MNSCSLRFFSDIKTNGSVVCWPVYITDIKLEKGIIATDWCAAVDENAMSANVSNAYSWRFSPTQGMYMWNGPQTGDAVFKIWCNDDGEQELYMKGKVVAESGSIAGWTIGKQGIYAENTGTEEGDETAELGVVGMYYGKRFCGTSLITGALSPIRFYAGRSVDTANFTVLEDGSAYMTAAKIGQESVITDGEGVISFKDFIDKHNAIDSTITEAFPTLVDTYESTYISFGNTMESLEESGV
jgi:hypothetical protein